MGTVDHYAQGTPSYVELTTPDQQAAKQFYGTAARLGVRGRRHGRGGGVRRGVGPRRLDRRDHRADAAAAGAPGVLGRLPGRRRRRRDGLEGRRGRRDGGGRAVRRDGAGPDGEHPGPDRRPGEPLAGRSEHRLGARQRARLPDLARADEPRPADRHAVLLRGARRRVGVDADGDRRRLHLPRGRGSSGRRRVPAADGGHPAALGRLLQRRGLRRDRGPRGRARRERAGPGVRPARRRPPRDDPRPPGCARGVPPEPAGGLRACLPSPGGAGRRPDHALASLPTLERPPV